MSEENVKDPITGAETSSENPVPVPGTDLQNIKPFIQLSNEKIDSEIESNRKQIDELNEKGSDLWNEEEQEKYKMISAETDALIKAKVAKTNENCKSCTTI